MLAMDSKRTKKSSGLCPTLTLRAGISTARAIGGEIASYVGRWVAVIEPRGCLKENCLDLFTFSKVSEYWHFDNQFYAAAF